MNKKMVFFDIVEKLGRIQEARRRGLISELEALESERVQYLRLSLFNRELGRPAADHINERIKQEKAESGKRLRAFLMLEE